MEKYGPPLEPLATTEETSAQAQEPKDGIGEGEMEGETVTVATEATGGEEGKEQLPSE